MASQLLLGQDGRWKCLRACRRVLSGFATGKLRGAGTGRCWSSACCEVRRLGISLRRMVGRPYSTVRWCGLSRFPHLLLLELRCRLCVVATYRSICAIYRCLGEPEHGGLLACYTGCEV